MSQVDLTPLQIIEVAKRLVTKTEIKEVGLRLEVEDHVIKGILNTSVRLVEAANDVLGEWRKTVATAREARGVLIQALLSCGQRSIVKEVFGQ